MWLQHLVLIPQIGHEATQQVHYWQTLYMVVVLYLLIIFTPHYKHSCDLKSMFLLLYSVCCTLSLIHVYFWCCVVYTCISSRLTWSVIMTMYEAILINDLYNLEMLEKTDPQWQLSSCGHQCSNKRRLSLWS